MKNDLVSICVATFNRKKKLDLAINSILDQTYEEIEVIIVDDCSSDGTENFVKENILCKDERVKYIKHDTNRGLAVSRNTAIENANGLFFSFCDDDDQWSPDFVYEFVKVAKEYNDNWSFCCGSEGYDYFGTKINVLPNFEGYLRDYIRSGYAPPVASQFYYLSSIKKAGGYNPDIKSGIDHDLWIRLAKINNKLKCLRLSLSKPNTDLDMSRMTTNYEKRIDGIKKSLKLWKNDLVDMYDKNFFEKFSKSYLMRENKKFLNYSLLKFDFKKIFFIKKHLSQTYFFKILIIFICKCFLKIILPNYFFPKERTLSSKPTLNI